VCAPCVVLSCSSREGVFEPAPLLVGEPPGLGGAIGQEGQYSEPEEDRRETLCDEQKLPAGEPKNYLIEGEKCPGERPTKNTCYCDSSHEERDGLRPLAGREPVG
jgi:hypothetical protein